MSMPASVKATHTCETDGLYNIMGENCPIYYQPKHPIKLGTKCLALFKTFLGVAQSSDYEGGWRDSAFSYAAGKSGAYACGLARSPSDALHRCNPRNTIGAGVEAEVESSPHGTRGEDLGGCNIYAISRVDDEVSIVSKEEPKKIVAKVKEEVN